MDKKKIIKQTDAKDLQCRKACQIGGKPGQPIDCGCREISVYKTGKKGAGRAEKEPVEQDQGNDEFIAHKPG